MGATRHNDDGLGGALQAGLDEKLHRPKYVAIKVSFAPKKSKVEPSSQSVSLSLLSLLQSNSDCQSWELSGEEDDVPSSHIYFVPLQPSKRPSTRRVDDLAPKTPESLTVITLVSSQNVAF